MDSQKNKRWLHPRLGVASLREGWDPNRVPEPSSQPQAAEAHECPLCGAIHLPPGGVNGSAQSDSPRVSVYDSPPTAITAVDPADSRGEQVAASDEHEADALPEYADDEYNGRIPW